MKKLLFLSIFIIFISAFFSAGGALAASEVILDDNVHGSECYGGKDDFYVDIPSFYSGSKVLLEAKPSSNPVGCADLGIDLCGWKESCYVNATPGQRVSFQVSWYCGYCGDYESENWYVYAKSVSGPVCGNGSCESGETCSSCSSDCGSCQQVSATPAPTPSSQIDTCQNVSLSAGTVYTYSKQAAPCSNYNNAILSNNLSFRCQSASAQWRNYWVKEIDVSKLKTLNIKSNLGINVRSGYFSECSGDGVKYDNYVSLAALSSDPRQTLSAECNKTCSEADWPKCSISLTSSNVLDYCGVAKCAASKTCDLNINVEGKDKIYLVFSTSDPWPFDIEGTISNLKTCGIASSASAAKKSNGSYCSSASECTGGYCVHGKCRASGAYCDDGYCDQGESCLNCLSDCGKCAVTPAPIENSLSKTNSSASSEESVAPVLEAATQNLLNEYMELTGEINSLDKKVNVAEVKLEVSPADMHAAILKLAKDLIEQNKADKAEALLKNAIAAEKLALATYNGEGEMSKMLAESTWQSFKVYLFSKIQVLLGAKLEKLGIPEADELTQQIKSSAGQIEDPAEQLKKMGFTDVAPLVGAIDKAFEQSQGDATKYLENIESQVKQVYVSAYMEMFNNNFKYAISDTLVYYQVSAWHYTEHIKIISNAEIPYNEYQAAIEKIKKELEEEKQFIADNNVFAKTAELNNKLIEGADEIDNVLEQLGAVTFAVDKGATLLGKETQFSDAIEALGKLNGGIKDMASLAADTLEAVGTFSKSVFGAYKEAKLYSVFFNTYDKWYDKCLGGSVTVLKIPLSDKKIDITKAYNLFSPLVGAADEILVAADGMVSDFIDGAKTIADAGVEMVKTTGLVLNTKLVRGSKAVQTIYSAGETLIYAAKWAGFMSANEENTFAVINPVFAQSNRAELVLVSPSGVKFSGKPYQDGSGVYAIINNPEKGDWTAEITTIAEELPIEIITSAEAASLGEIKSEKIEKSAGLEFSYPIIAIAFIIIIGGLINWQLGIWKKNKLKQG